MLESLTRRATASARKALVSEGREVVAKTVVKDAGAIATRDVAKVAARDVATVAAKDGYEAAARRIEKRIGAEKLLQSANAKGKVRLQAHAESLFLHRPDAKGTVMLFHGFTAGPWQYEELAKRLQQEGYNVYAPRMPGHGFMRPDGQITGEYFVSAAKRHKYDEFVKARFAEAEALGQPVWVAGLSGGANLALRTAEMYPQVKGVFDMAPFLGADGALSWVFKILAGLDKLTFGAFGTLLDKIPQGKNGLANAANALPHNQSTYGAALAMRDVGAKIHDIKAPVQFITTEGDKLSGEGFVGKYFKRTGGAKENGWFHFEKAAGVPHAMIDRRQNKAPGAVDQLTEMLVSFLKTGKTVLKPPA